MRYSAPWDGSLRASTAALLVLIGLWAATMVVLAAAAGASAVTVALGTALVVALGGGGVLMAWAFAPKGFAIEGAHVRVDRPLRPISIPLAGVRAAGLLPDGSLARLRRLGGSSGLFGHYGLFWSKRLGSFRMYATRKSGLVMLETAGGVFVLSPEPAQRFVEEVLGRSGGAVRAEGAAPLERRPIPRRFWIGLAAALAFIPIALAGVFATVFAFTPRAVRVEAGAVRIEREHASPVVIPLAQVRHVELLPRDRAGRLRRVSGTAGARASWGHYRSDVLGHFQLYAWRQQGPYVLLDTVDGRVVLTPDEPEAFVAAVRAGMGEPPPPR